MDHDTLEKLKQSHTTLKLLNADNMPLIVGFLHKVFIQPNKRDMPLSDVISRLDDHLYQLRQIHGDEKYPRSAKAYVEDWSSGENAFLRKYYPEVGDEPYMDLTPATEKAVEWLTSLKARQFIGTESRLLAIFQLLRDIVYKTEQDPEARIRVLEQQKQELEREIERIRRDGVLPYDPTQVKERFFHLDDTARKLLGDFRQVEHNFRILDRQTRERIAKSDKTKGELLDEIFHDQDVIRDSDQGKSFRAFWEFLMSKVSQEELRDLLKRVFSLPEIRELHPERFLQEIPYFLLDAGEKVYQTGNLLVEQLRKYLDDQAYLENRRIMGLIKNIEKTAVAIKDHAPEDRRFAALNDVKPAIDFTMGSRLFSPSRNPVIQVSTLKAGEADIQMDALYQQRYMDMNVLRENIRKALQTVSQISLAVLAEQFPLQKGLAELLGYLHLAAKDRKAMINDGETEIIRLTTEKGVQKQVEMPQVIFVR